MKKRFLRMAALLLAAVLLLTGCNMPTLGDVMNKLYSAIQLGFVTPFDEMEYVRPDPDQFRQEMDTCMELAQTETDVDTLMESVYTVYGLYYDFATNYYLANIHYCKDMTDSYWSEEYSYCMEQEAQISAAMDQLLYALADSPLRAELESDSFFGEGFFDLYEGDSLWDETFTALMEQESALLDQYYDLNAQAVEVEYYSEEFFSGYGYQIEEVFLELVKVRRQIATYAGYDSYPAFAYEFYFYRDYTPEQTVSYLEQIKTELVPLYTGIDTTVWEPMPTSISLASGLAKARDILNQKYNVIAVIGDGSLSGGEALEGLNFVGSELNSNFIVIVNDNNMSIAENHGALYGNLKLLRETKGTAELNMFKAWGYDYLYVEDGNDLESLISAFEQVKNYQKPIVVHLNTEKGKGYSFAENCKEPWHWSVPFDIKTGEKKFNFSGENYNDITYNFLKDKIDEGENIIILTAGTPGVFGLNADKRKELNKHYIDVGIAEEHAVAMSSGLAKAACKPVFCVMSSFIQRTYDQLSQDLAMNKNPAVILVFWGGISDADETHLCTFDMSMMSNIPNLVCLSPTTKQEYLAMLEASLSQNENPVVIRVPQKVVNGDEINTNWEELQKSKIIKYGSNVAVLALGNFMNLGSEVCNLLNKEGLNPTLVNQRNYSVLDENLLDDLSKNHKIIVTLEDGILNGGFGEKIASFYGSTNIKVLNFGAKKEFTHRENVESIYRRNNLLAEQIVDKIKNIL